MEGHNEKKQDTSNRQPYITLMKILHTSDVHLGMRFASYPEVQEELREARFAALAKCVEHANANSVDLLTIGGDLFDRTSVAMETLARSADILKSLQDGLVVVLPGNHDFLSPEQGSLWSKFREAAAGNTLILTKSEPYDLRQHEVDACVYPGPCTSKHSAENAIGWIREAKHPDARFHIGMAHGSLEGLSPDFDGAYYPMTESELLACHLDVWLMGHTHIPHPAHPSARDRIFFPSTPEPDGFDCRHRGQALLIEIEDDKKLAVQTLPTGKYAFKHEDAEVNSSENITNLASRFDREDWNNTLLKLRLSGRLSRDAFAELAPAVESIRRRTKWLDIALSDVAMAVTRDDVNREFSKDSFPHRLLSTLADKDDSQALQVAYEILQEARR